MADSFLHGVQILELSGGPRPIQTAMSSIIGLVGTAANADPILFPLNTPVLIANSRVMAASLGLAGTLPDAVDSILDQTGAVIIVVRVADGVDTNTTLANVIGGTDANTGKYTGAYAFLGAESILGFAPRILCAAGFSYQRPNGNANPVVASMIPIAERLRAVIMVDGPNTNDAAAITAAGDFGSARVYLCDPWVLKVDSTGNTYSAPPSAVAAGLLAKQDNDQGFWWSPSNQNINGIVGTTRPVDFVLGDASSRANLLNAKNVATVIRQDGYRLWGNRTLSSDPKWMFLSVRRTADIINDSLLRAHLWAVDRNISKTYADDVVEGVNDYLRHLKAIGAIIDGNCWYDKNLNTPSQIAQGKVSFDFDFTPPFPAENITFRSHMVNDYLVEIF